jgi:hypothetical protein
MSKYNTAKIIKNSIYLILIIILIGYAIFNSRIFIAGPKIIIESPENGISISESPLVDIVGRAENIAFIELNGRQINVDESANFDEAVLLYPGYNIITITARDKFEREIEEKLEIVYQNNDLLIDNNENSETASSTLKILENGTSTATTTLEIATSTPTTSLEEI